MRARYRRKRLTRADEAAATAASLALGAGVAAVAFYFTRLFLSRERMGPKELPATEDHPRALPAGEEGTSDGSAG